MRNIINERRTAVNGTTWRIPLTVAALPLALLVVVAGALIATVLAVVAE